MSKYYGDFLPGKTVRARFNTANASGVPTSLASGAVIVSKDGADVTPSGGVTLTADVGSVVGRNVVVIDMSVDTATFTVGSEYAVRLSGTSNVGGTSAVGLVVGEWSIANRSVSVDTLGVSNANVVKFAGVTAYAYDGILASATATTVTFPATDVAGNTIPDDGRFQFTQFDVVDGLGAGQTVSLGLRTGLNRQYTVAFGMAVTCDSTSKYVLRGSTIAELDLTQPVPTANTTQTVGDALNAARAQAFGPWLWPDGTTTLTMKAADGTTVHTHNLDSATAPRSRN